MTALHRSFLENTSAKHCKQLLLSLFSVFYFHLYSYVNLCLSKHPSSQLTNSNAPWYHNRTLGSHLLQTQITVCICVIFSKYLCFWPSRHKHKPDMKMVFKNLKRCSCVHKKVKHIERGISFKKKSCVCASRSQFAIICSTCYCRHCT